MDAFTEQANLFHSEALNDAATPLFEKMNMRIDPNDPIGSLKYVVVCISSLSRASEGGSRAVSDADSASPKSSTVR